MCESCEWQQNLFLCSLFHSFKDRTDVQPERIIVAKILEWFSAIWFRAASLSFLLSQSSDPPLDLLALSHDTMQSEQVPGNAVSGLETLLLQTSCDHSNENLQTFSKKIHWPPKNTLEKQDLEVMLLQEKSFQTLKNENIT